MKPTEPTPKNNLDPKTIGLAVFFVALIVIVAAVSLLTVL